jgi:phosphopantothenate-cysteine ligase
MNVLVTGGATSAPIDDVRAITNVSTGRLAAAISERCLAHGACVWYLHAPAAQLPFFRWANFDLDRDDPGGEFDRLRGLQVEWKAVRDRLHLVPLRFATVGEYSQNLRCILQDQSIDVAFLVMAVSDYEPSPLHGKLSSDDVELVIRCRRTPKVIRLVRDWAPSVYLVGFKLLSRASTSDLIRQAEASGRINRADLTVANDLQTLLAGKHTLHLVRAGHPPQTLEPGEDLADRLVLRVLDWASNRYM